MSLWYAVKLSVTFVPLFPGYVCALAIVVFSPLSHCGKYHLVLSCHPALRWHFRPYAAQSATELFLLVGADLSSSALTILLFYVRCPSRSLVKFSGCARWFSLAGHDKEGQRGNDCWMPQGVGGRCA